MYVLGITIDSDIGRILGQKNMGGYSINGPDSYPSEEKIVAYRAIVWLFIFARIEKTADMVQR